MLNMTISGIKNKSLEDIWTAKSLWSMCTFQLLKRGKVLKSLHLLCLVIPIQNKNQNKPPKIFLPPDLKQLENEIQTKIDNNSNFFAVYPHQQIHLSINMHPSKRETCQ